jgi:hypothetical protein
MPPATAGWQQQAASQSRRWLFIDLSPDSFFSLSYLWWENNQTTHACWKTYWNCIAFELGTLCGGFVCVCAVLFYLMFPLWWEKYRTTSEAPSPGLEAEGETPKLLRLKLNCIWTWRVLFLFFILFCFILFLYILFLSFTYFLFLFISIFFSFFIFKTSLCLSNPFSVYGWLVHSLPV